MNPHARARNKNKKSRPFTPEGQPAGPTVANGPYRTTDGETVYFRRGLVHRDDGPAIVGARRKCWVQNGLISHQARLDKATRHEACVVPFISIAGGAEEEGRVWADHRYMCVIAMNLIRENVSGDFRFVWVSFEDDDNQTKHGLAGILFGVDETAITPDGVDPSKALVTVTFKVLPDPTIKVWGVAKRLTEVIDRLLAAHSRDGWDTQELQLVTSHVNGEPEESPSTADGTPEEEGVPEGGEADHVVSSDDNREGGSSH